MLATEQEAQRAVNAFGLHEFWQGFVILPDGTRIRVESGHWAIRSHPGMDDTRCVLACYESDIRPGFIPLKKDRHKVDHCWHSATSYLPLERLLGAVPD